MKRVLDVVWLGLVVLLSALAGLDLMLLLLGIFNWVHAYFPLRGIIDKVAYGLFIVSLGFSFTLVLFGIVHYIHGRAKHISSNVLRGYTKRMILRGALGAPASWFLYFAFWLILAFFYLPMPSVRLPTYLF